MASEDELALWARWRMENEGETDTPFWPNPARGGARVAPNPALAERLGYVHNPTIHIRKTCISNPSKFFYFSFKKGCIFFFMMYWIYGYFKAVNHDEL